MSPIPLGILASAVAGGVEATGGTIFDLDGYRYHKFTSSGTFTVIKGGDIEVLAVAGGGGAPYEYWGSTGYYGYSGAGGAGGQLYAALTIDPAAYAITVGAGGTGQPLSQSVNPTNGNNSSLGSLVIAIGGGHGSRVAGSPLAAGNGGSGGGGGALSGYGGASGGGTGIPGQGFNGSAGFSNNATNTYGGAGGGAGAAASGVNGGIGSNTYSVWLAATSSGESGYIAGGGAGARNYGPVIAPLGGGGDGGSYNPDVKPQNGVANTGGGAGGGSGPGPSGGSGIVLVRYAA